MEHLTESPEAKEPWEMTKLEFRFTPYNTKILDNIKKKQELDVIGTLGDFFVGDRVREIFNDILDVQIVVLTKPIVGGKQTDLPGAFHFKGSYGHFRGQPTIFINPAWDDKWHGDITHTIIEEASHALRSAMGRDVVVPEITKLDDKMFDIYKESTGELSAKKLYDYTVKIQEDTHRRAVEQAIKEGKSIPSEVLVDYPELAPKVSEREYLT